VRQQVRTTKSFSITVPTKLAAEIDRAAAAQCRSRSSLLAWLIRQAVKQEIHEEKALQSPDRLRTGCAPDAAAIIKQLVWIRISLAKAWPLSFFLQPAYETESDPRPL
jgi:predicted transcriptional regulator